VKSQVTTGGEKMEKLVFMSTRSNEDRDSVVVRIDREASQMLADIQQRTGFSLRFIASRMIEFAYENVEVREPQINFFKTKKINKDEE
jgi:hypothetical protein